MIASLYTLTCTLCVIFLLSLFAPRPVFAQSYSYPTQEYIVHKGNNIWSSAWGPSFVFDSDVLITSASFSIQGMGANTSHDVCLYLTRENSPELLARTAAGSEILCSTARRALDNSAWNGLFDVSRTPLYLPKGTRLFCESTGFNIVDPSAVRFGCNISYRQYNPGDARYRSLRLPFVDQDVQGDGTIPPVFYLSNPGFPLRVRGFGIFESMRSGTGRDICLTHLRQGGAVVNKACAPDISVQAGGDYTSPTTIYPVHFDIPPASYDILSATCRNSTSPSDCALWAFVEIPATVPFTADAILANFGLVPSPHLGNYCAFHVESLRKHPFFCNSAQTCTDATRIQTCSTKLFPQSLSTSTNPTPTLTPVQSGKIGDINGDRAVDIFDYNMLVAAFGSTGAVGWISSDLVKNGRIDIFDYNVFVENYGR